MDIQTFLNFFYQLSAQPQKCPQPLKKILVLQNLYAGFAERVFPAPVLYFSNSLLYLL